MKTPFCFKSPNHRLDREISKLTLFPCKNLVLQGLVLNDSPVQNHSFENVKNNDLSLDMRGNSQPLL